MLTADKKQIGTRGVVTLELQYDGKTITEDFYVVKDLKNPLLGLPAIEKLKIITRMDKNVEKIDRPRVSKFVCKSSENPMKPWNSEQKVPCRRERDVIK